MGNYNKTQHRRCFVYAAYRDVGPYNNGTDKTATPERVRCSPRSSSIYMFPDFVLQHDRNTPLCEKHARHYYGDPAIDRLIRLGFLKDWNHDASQGVLPSSSAVPSKGEWLDVSS
jgi:hypothetical protein